MEWIPTSVRMPSEQGHYLVTFPLCNGEPWVYILSFNKGKFYETDDEWGDVEYDDVTAWMPLPKPWKGANDTPQTDCETCKYGQDKHRYAHICNECGVGINNYTPQTETQTETQNSNLTFEKVMEEIQTQVIEFPDTHQKFTFARKIEMDGDSIKIGGWEYKGVKDGKREGE